MIRMWQSKSLFCGMFLGSLLGRTKDWLLSMQIFSQPQHPDSSKILTGGAPYEGQC